MSRNGSVPEGWRRVRLGDVARIAMGRTPARSRPEYWDPDKTSGNRWVTIADMRGGEITDTSEYISDAGAKASGAPLVPPGTPLMSFKLTLGRVAIPRVPVYTNEAIAAVYSNGDVSGEFLAYSLPALAQGGPSDAAVKGRTLNLAKLRELSLLLPPVAERERIVSILRSIDESIERTETVTARAAEAKRTLALELLTRGVPRRHTRYKQTPAGEIPECWEVRPVNAVGEVRLGRQRAPQHQSGRFTRPYLRVANVFDGWIDYSDVAVMDFTPKERAIYDLMPGDILLNEGQSLELVGRSAIYDGEPSAYCFQNTLVRFRSSQLALPSYCRAVFKHWFDKGIMQAIGRQTTSVAHLGADRFARLQLPLPPLGEQTEIVGILNSVDARTEREMKALTQLRSSKERLAHALLTGEVRVSKVDDG